MARIRTIKPEFWQDEKLAPLDPIHRLVFLGLVSQADDAGRLVDNVRLLNGLLFPCTEDDCRESIEVLVRLSRVSRYTSESGQRLLQIVNWGTHQRVVNPSQYTLPGPPLQDDATQPLSESSLDSSETVNSPVLDPKFPTNDHLPSTNDHLPSTNKAHTEEFEDAWSIYPKREGSNPKAKALKAWKARVKGGTDPAEMIEGTKRYRRFCDAKGNTGGPYVMQAATFYGPDKRWAEEYSVNGISEPSRDLIRTRLELEGLDLERDL
jgi:hypothetical protein